jgi:peptidyl-prolyl cis-trans isomerase SurA
MKQFFIAASVLFFSSVFAQADKNAVLFSVSGEPVSVADFEYVYTKNNINNQADYSEKSLRDYLALYENFRLKVKEAEAQKLDTISGLMNELDGYRKQLAKSFLTDKEISDKLLQEAYDRSLKEVNVSHILIKCDENANPQDTLTAYKKALSLRTRLTKNEDFGKLARDFSDDPSAKDNAGEIGWFSVFQTVYPFETAAFNMKAGELSFPVRTQFGYHIIKLVQTRPAQGEIRTAHLLLKFPQDATEEQRKKVQARIDSVYNTITSGSVSFDDAVLTFSEDRTTRNKKGELAWFGTGRMVPEFENAAFALAKDGDVSKPTKTAYGWHIIKRLEKKPIPAFNDVKADLKRKVERDSRSQVAKTILIDRIKKESNFKEFTDAKAEFFKKVDSTLAQGKWHSEELSKSKKTLFEIGGKVFTQSDFESYVTKNAKRRTDKNKENLLNEYYDNFVSQTVLDFEEGQLENKKPDFKALMKEYRDGILLFELTDRMVWSKAVKDTVGLQAFHDQNKSKYMWGNRVDVVIYNTTDKKLADAAYKLANKKKDANAIKTKLNKEGAAAKISTIEGKYEKGQYSVVDEIAWNAGTTPVKLLDDSSYRFIVVKSLVEPEPKTLKEAKGYVVSDYQEYLEKTWIAELRKKYPIVLNESVLKALIKK